MGVDYSLDVCKLNILTYFVSEMTSAASILSFLSKRVCEGVLFRSTEQSKEREIVEHRDGTGTGQNFSVFAYFLRKKRYKTTFLEIRHLSFMSEIISINEYSKEYSIPSKIIVENISYFMHRA